MEVNTITQKGDTNGKGKGKGKKGQTRKCFLCDSPDHLLGECPLKKDLLAKKEVQVVKKVEEEDKKKEKEVDRNEEKGEGGGE